MADKRKVLQSKINFYNNLIKGDKKHLENENRPAHIKYFKENIKWSEAARRAAEIELLILDAKELGEDTTLLKKELDDIKKKNPIL